MTNFWTIKSYALHCTHFKGNFHNVPDGSPFKGSDFTGILTVDVDSSVVVDVVLVVLVVVVVVVVVGGSVGSPL